jgi:hypothetical protein
MRFCALRACLSRLVLVMLCAIPAFVASVNAQVAGRNINMVSGGTFPGGDPHLQKQNEPSLAMSTRNPCHLLAGANDYRAVNLPGLPGDAEIGDAWLGWYESTDCGATWYSTLVPGYPQDASPAGMASPVKGLSAGADPVIRSGAAGTFYYLFIAFNRGSNVGKLALARAIDHNDRESFIDPSKPEMAISFDGNTNPRRVLSPIQYAGTTEVARGSAGKFIDKPSLAVYPASTGTCLMDGETVPATNVYTAWTEFVGNSPDNLRTKVYFARSVDCGKTFEPATKLSEGYPLGQGTVIAVNPNNRNDIYVVWRQIRSDRGQDALLFARSLDGGRSFTKAEFIPGFTEGLFRPFDQNTTSKSGGSLTTTFRTVAYPSLAFADDGYLYLAVSQVPLEFYTPGALGGAQARIYMTRANSAGWNPQPVPVITDADAAGQQFMPALAYAAGKMQMVWYDVRFDEAFEPSQITSKPLIDDAESMATVARRRTIDVLGAQASFSVTGGVVSTVWPPAFTRYGVSQPDYNDTDGGAIPSRGPRVSQYLTGDAQPGVNQTPAGARQLLFNRGGLELYGGGTIPFIGDYIDVAPIQFVFNAATGKWDFNFAVNGKPSLQTFQAAWTDNRDAMVGKAVLEQLPTNPALLRYKYEMPLALNGGIVSDASCPVPGVDNTRSRDANVYTSRITQDFTFTAVSNSKHNAAGVIRAFAVQLTNNDELDPNVVDAPTAYTLKIDATARASFSRKSFRIVGQTCADAPAPNNVPVREITVNVLPRGSVARTIYVPCGVTGPIAVTATDNSSGASGSVLINSDPANPGAKGPDGQPLGPESHNPDVENPDVENPDVENPDVENPDVENPDVENPDVENPDVENPDVENPDVENPDVENPDVENPDVENANFQDVSTDVTNDGDTTSGYQVNAGVSGDTTGYEFLLMGRRVYATPTSINCHLVQKRTNQMLFSIPLDGADLTGEFFDENDPSEKHPTFLVRPGESIRVTLRVVSNGATTPPFCSADPSSPDWCFNRVIIKSQAQAPNTGDIEPKEDVIGNFADLTVAGTLSAPPEAGMGGFVDMPATTIRNEGNRTAEPDGTFRWDYYASLDPVIEGGRANDVPFGVGDFATKLAPDGSIAFGPRRLVMPNVADLSFYVGILTDADDTVTEGSESNNTLVTPSAIKIAPYTTTINMGTIDDPDNPGKPIPVANVSVRRDNGPSQDSSGVPGASVALSLERPIAPNNEPGTPEPAFQVMTGVTDDIGRVQFVLPATLPGSGSYRFIATVTIVGVPAPLKYQSACFDCGPILK